MSTEGQRRTYSIAADNKMLNLPHRSSRFYRDSESGPVVLLGRPVGDTDPPAEIGELAEGYFYQVDCGPAPAPSYEAFILVGRKFIQLSSAQGVYLSDGVVIVAQYTDHIAFIGGHQGVAGGMQ